MIIHLIAASTATDARSAASSTRCSQVRGAYSLVFLTEDQRHRGARPRRLPAAGARAGRRRRSWSRRRPARSTSSTPTYEREVEPGEIVVIERARASSRCGRSRPRRAHHCVFEYIYFARPDSQVFGRNVYEVRKELGRQLARESARAGRHRHPGARLRRAGRDRLRRGGRAAVRDGPHPQPLRRPHLHRAARSSIRHFGVKVKLNALREVLDGKRVVVVDDSIVRGTTSRKLVHMIRQAGAREVHMRISSPPTTQPVLLRHRHADARGADRLVALGRRRSASTSAPTRSPT